MRKQSHILVKLILASMLLSIACSIKLNWISTGCTGADVKVFARVSDSDTTGTGVCVSAADYGTEPGCKFYLVDAGLILANLASGAPQLTTTKFTCNGGVKLEAPTSGNCASGYSLVNARKAAGDSNVAVCVKTTNTVASPQLLLGC
jgi:hypothetical protein